MYSRRLLAVLLVVLVLLMGGCRVAVPDKTEDCASATSELLEFSGISWGATPEEAMAIMNLFDDMVECYDGEQFEEIHLIGYSCFGLTAERVVLLFEDFIGEGKPKGLRSMYISFPDDVGLEMVRQGLQKVCGSPTDSYRIASRSLETQETVYETYQTGEHECY